MIVYKTISNFLTEEECQNVLNRFKDDELYDGKVGFDKLDLKERKSKINFHEIDWIKDRLLSTLNENIVFKNANFEEINKFQFTKYSIGDFYGWHTDYSDKKPEYKQRFMSIVILLNNDYEGGDLKYKNSLGEEFTFQRGTGNLFIFNSSTLHKVTPVTSGERYSLVNWLSIKQTNFSKTLL